MNAIGKTMMAVSTALLLGGSVACNRNKEPHDFGKRLGEVLNEYYNNPALYTQEEIDDFLTDGEYARVVTWPHLIDVNELDKIEKVANERRTKALSDFENNANKTRQDSIDVYNVLNESEKTMEAVEFLRLQRALYDAKQRKNDSIAEANRQAEYKKLSADMKDKIEEYMNPYVLQ